MALLPCGGAKKDKGEILRNYKTPVIMLPVSSGIRSPEDVASKGMQILQITVT